MDSRWDLEAKLTDVSDWVRREYAVLADAAEDLGCTVVSESGPGTSHRIQNRAVIRMHPKLAHLAVGFPNALRDDVATLTGALRSQRGEAWLNYSPDVCDRETVLMLIAKSASSRATGAAPSASPTMPPGGRLSDPSDRDVADLTLVLDVLRAFRRYSDATATQPAVKVIREAIYFHWDAPRMPAGGKYSSSLPHSPAARARKEAGHRDGFVLEHVLPVNVLIRSLLADVPTDIHALRKRLDDAADRVIITREEDAALGRAGVGSSVPIPGEPWSRYAAAGFDYRQFAPLT